MSSVIVAGQQTVQTPPALLSAVATDLTGPNQPVGGRKTAYIWVINSDAGGTISLTVKGSYDNVNYVNAAYQRVDAQATLTRSVTAFAVTASMVALLQVIDWYPWLQITTTSAAGFGVGSVTATLYTLAI